VSKLFDDIQAIDSKRIALNIGIKKSLLSKNFVVSEQGFYVYKGGVRSKVPIVGMIVKLED
jgi:hypothetical protein